MGGTRDGAKPPEPKDKELLRGGRKLNTAGVPERRRMGGWGRRNIDSTPSGRGKRSQGGSPLY